MGRLSEDGTTPNASLTLYHLRKAGECGVMEALYVLGHIYLQLPHEDFQMVSVEVCNYSLSYLIQNVCSSVSLLGESSLIAAVNVITSKNDLVCPIP